MDANTVALWHCNEGFGSGTADATGRYPLGFKATGEPAWTAAGRFGYALRFDGVDDVLTHDTLGNGGMPNGTLEMWIKPNVTIDSTLSYTPNLWVKGGAIREYFTLNWEYAGDGRLWFKLRSESLGNIFIPSITNVWSANTWYHVAVTWGGQGAKFFVNGVLEGSNPITRALLAGTYYKFAIGGYPVSNTAFNGTIDEIRLSDIQRFAGAPAKYILRGNVKSSAGISIPGAVVAAYYESTTTDLLGNYVLEYDEGWSGNVTVSATGYGSRTQMITLYAGENRLDFTLLPSGGWYGWTTMIGSPSTILWSISRSGNMLNYRFIHAYGDDTGSYNLQSNCTKVRILARAQNPDTGEWIIRHDQGYTGDFSASGAANAIAGATTTGLVYIEFDRWIG